MAQETGNYYHMNLST